MNTPDEFFRPEEVDEQIERLRQQSPSDAHADAELIDYLHNSYAMDAAQERATLQRMWARINNAAPGVEPQHTRKGTVTPMQERQTLRSNAPSHKQSHPRGQRIGILAAVLFLAILVGSMAFVFNAARHTTTTASPANGGRHLVPTPTVAPRPTPVPANMGKVVYSMHVSDADGIDAYALNWSPDSKRLAIGTQRAQSWDATSGKNVVNYGPLRSGSIMDVVFSPDGKRVAVTSVGYGVQIYDAKSGQLLMTYTGSSQARTTGGGPLVRLNMPASGGSGSGFTAWSPDGTLMASSFFTPGANNIQIWNTTTGKMLLQYNGHADFVESIAWSPDGKNIISASVDGSIQVWAANSGKKLRDIEEHERNVITAAFSPDGKRIAYTDNDAVEIIDAQTGKLLLEHNGPNDQFGLSVLAWSPDGSSIASAGVHIELWNTATSKTYYTFNKNPSSIRLLVWSPDSKYIASADSPEATATTLQVWIA